MIAFLELTPQFKKLKRRASLEFRVHLDMSQIGIVRFTKRCLGFSKFRASIQTSIMPKLYI